MKLRPTTDCQLDVLRFGECMIRLSPPGHQRIELTPVFEAWAGGRGYNVSYAQNDSNGRVIAQTQGGEGLCFDKDSERLSIAHWAAKNSRRF